MSTISAPPGSVITMEALIKLIEFISNPRYIDRIKELQAAQQAADDSAAEYAKQYGIAISAIKNLENCRRDYAEQVRNFETEKEAHRIAQSALDAAHQKRAAELDTMETDLLARIGEDENNSRLKSNELDDREEEVARREKEVTDREFEVARRESKVNHKLQKLREMAE